MFSIFKTSAPAPTDLLTSTLYDQDTFYPQFIRDLQQCSSEVVIESPWAYLYFILADITESSLYWIGEFCLKEALIFFRRTIAARLCGG